MNKPFKVTMFCAATLAVFATAGFLTSGPAFAQGGRPATEVKVVNSSTEPVPVSVQGTASVDVNSLPAIQVGNTAGNPVPVEITNAPDPGRPVAIRGDLIFFTGMALVTEDVYTVPAGKVLRVEAVSFSANHESGSTTDYVVSVSGTYNGANNFASAASEAEMPSAEYGSKKIDVLASAGQIVRCTARRTFAQPVVGTAYHTNVSIIGRLYDAP